ncbi:MAG: metallopeptidase family protein [Solirubrobacteraceae bacterium]
MRGAPSSLRQVAVAALAAMTVGIGLLTLVAGFNSDFLVRLLQGLAVFGAGALLVGGAVVLALVRLADWRDPESEKEFEALVQRAERLASEGSWGATEDHEAPAGEGHQAPAGEEDEDFYLLDDDDHDDDEQDFRALVRSAVDELPLEFHRALEHVAVVVADGGRKYRAYGLYQGDTIAQDYFHERIVIFRDTLMRDFGHDPELLRARVTRTLRHELAHHLGWGEKGVRKLGL